MKSMRVCFTLMLFSVSLLLPWRSCAGEALRHPLLDSLAVDISRLGRIPSGGHLMILAASNGWFGMLTGVNIVPGTETDLSQFIRDYGQNDILCGLANWTGTSDVLVVTAPRPVCWPVGIDPCIDVGSSLSFTIEGYSGLIEPVTAVADPSMNAFTLLPGDDGTFLFNASEKGVYWIEVLQNTSTGPSVEMLFPVVCGGSFLDVLEGRIDIPFSSAESPEDVFDELNGLRIRFGLEPLVRDPELDSIASIRAGRLAVTGVLTHIDSNAGSLGAILPRTVDIFGENIGRGNGFQEAWSMIMISPLHLKTCLSPSYSSIGIAGAVDCTDYEWQLILVQAFVSEAETR